MNGEIKYGQVSCKIYESWATAVEWHITSMEYREKGIANYGSPTYYSIYRPARNAYQYWLNFINERYPYTSLFIDIVDSYNQAGRFGGVSITDNLQGYTIGRIESDVLKYVFGLSSLRTRLKAKKPTGVSDTQIDELLNQF